MQIDSRSLSAATQPSGGFLSLSSSLKNLMKSKSSQIIIALVVILSFSGWVFPSQTTELPSYSTIDRIKDHRKVYVASDNEDSRKRIIKSLGKDKSLEIVNSPD